MPYPETTSDDDRSRVGWNKIPIQPMRVGSNTESPTGATGIDLPARRARAVCLPVLALRRTARLTLRPPLRAVRRSLRATLRLPRRAARRAPALRRATFRLTRRTLRFAVRRTRRAAERRRTLLRDFFFAMCGLRMR
jgi:hypothetical protein